MSRLVSWVDPETYEPLKEINGQLVSSSNQYPIVNGIPNFIKNEIDDGQIQVKNSFGYKWTRSNFGQHDDDFNKKAKRVVMEFIGLTENDLKIFDNKIILDTGIGSGSSARLWASRAKEFHGVDISEAIFKVKNALHQSKNYILSQSDLNRLPYENEVFDIIISLGVFHHTPDTKEALKNAIRTLKKDGILFFYIYKKKSPIREFSDDYIRKFVSNMPHDEAWKVMEPITKFGKAIHDQKTIIDVPEDISILNIKKGKYDLQEFIYNYFFKCFWNNDYGFDDSVMTNFDWYHPKYSWRHSENEIKNWCNEFNLNIDFLKETYSGYSCKITKNS